MNTLRTMSVVCVLIGTAMVGCRPDGSVSPSSNRLGVAWNPRLEPTTVGRARGGGPPSPAELPTVGPLPSNGPDGGVIEPTEIWLPHETIGRGGSGD